MSNATVERLAKSMILEYWLNGSDQRPGGWTHTATAVDGVPFNPEVAADVAPFTPEQVLDSVGYVHAGVRDRDRDRSGIVGLDHRWMEVTFEILTPADRTDAQPWAEEVRGHLEAHFEDSFIPHDDAPEFTLRHLPDERQNESIDHEDLDPEPDDGWRHNFLRIFLQRQQLPAPVGEQEVTPP